MTNSGLIVRQLGFSIEERKEVLTLSAVGHRVEGAVRAIFNSSYPLASFVQTITNCYATRRRYFPPALLLDGIVFQNDPEVVSSVSKRQSCTKAPSG